MENLLLTVACSKQPKLRSLADLADCSNDIVGNYSSSESDQFDSLDDDQSGGKQ